MREKWNAESRRFNGTSYSRRAFRAGGRLQQLKLAFDPAPYEQCWDLESAASHPRRRRGEHDRVQEPRPISPLLTTFCQLTASWKFRSVRRARSNKEVPGNSRTCSERARTRDAPWRVRLETEVSRLSRPGEQSDRGVQARNRRCPPPAARRGLRVGWRVRPRARWARQRPQVRSPAVSSRRV